MANPDTVYLLDASIYIFRAWFGYPDTIVDKQGRSVNAVLGYWRQLLAGLKLKRPDRILVAFDESLFSGFRHHLYPEYKANRALPDDALAYQLFLCRELTDALGICTRSSQVYEADDVLFTAARVARQAGHVVDVVTRDKDLAQIVAPGDCWSDWHAGQSLDHDQLTARWGVTPPQIPEVLALAGDAVDNIPGVPQVGLKTAVSLIQHFGTLENMFGNIEQIMELPIRGALKLHRRLQEHQGQALLFRELVRLHIADCDIGVQDFAFSPPTSEKITALLNELALGPAFKREWERYQE